jgi:undecaprenyl-diphosphatase
MVYIDYIILGLIQGLTEFLPVSSSGHLVLASSLLRIDVDTVAIILVAHLGTLAAMILFFLKDIISLLTHKRLIGHILWVSLITGIIAISGKGFFESLFNSNLAVGAALLITGIVLIVTKFSCGAKNMGSINIKDSFLLGLAQGLSVIPGLSRSGLTICLLLFRGFEKESAFRFSFLAAIPAILGAFLFKMREIDSLAGLQVKGLSLAFFFSFISGLFALKVLKAILHKAKFHYFGYYCIILGALLFFVIRG